MMGDAAWGWGWGKPPAGKAADKGESLVDVHNSLPKEIQQHLKSQSPEAHDEALKAMRSMMPGERVRYGRGLMEGVQKTQGGSAQINRNESSMMGDVEK